MAAYLTALEASDFNLVVQVLDKYVDGGLKKRQYPVLFAAIASMGATVSEAMIEAARQRFAGLTNVGVVDIRQFDLRQGYPPVQASVTLAVLTIQFVPIEYRQRILRDVYKSTIPGGAFIFVEKTLGATAEIDQDMVRVYYGLKAEHGYTTEQIERKRLSLEGVLVPVTAAWNEELLRMAGFRHVDCFWRWMNFAGWIAVKE